MNYVNKEKHVFTFSNLNKPVLRVNSGDSVIFETLDCMSNQINSYSYDLGQLDFDKVNPATGPIYIEGANPGTVLKVFIKAINLQGNAVTMTGPGVGVLGNKLDKMTFNIMDIIDDKAIFKGIELPLNKMIGVIGVAPYNDSINCGTPGSHGGNMDCKIISEGTNIYLPVFNEGALLSMGDVHAVMGDGEIGVSGAEIGAEIHIEVEVINNITLQNPIIETNDCYYTIASALTLDEAYKIAVENMFDIVFSKCDLSKNDLIMLLSLTADIEVCQVVDPLKTIRFKLSKEILKKINITSLI